VEGHENLGLYPVARPFWAAVGWKRSVSDKGGETAERCSARQARRPASPEGCTQAGFRPCFFVRSHNDVHENGKDRAGVSRPLCAVEMARP
jgi:hypothetical protein